MELLPGELTYNISEYLLNPTSLKVSSKEFYEDKDLIASGIDSKETFEEMLPYLLLASDEFKYNFKREHPNDYPFTWLIHPIYIFIMLNFWYSNHYLDFLPDMIQDLIVYDYYKSDGDDLRFYHMLHDFFKPIFSQINYNNWRTTNRVGFLHFLEKIRKYTNSIVYSLFFNDDYTLSNGIKLFTEYNIFPIKKEYFDYRRLLKDDSNEIDREIQKANLIHRLTVQPTWKYDEGTCQKLTREELKTYIEKVYFSESECKNDEQAKPIKDENFMEASSTLLRSAFQISDIYLAELILKYSDYEQRFSLFLNPGREYNDKQVDFLIKNLVNESPISKDIIRTAEYLLADLIRKRDKDNYNFVLDLIPDRLAISKKVEDLLKKPIPYKSRRFLSSVENLLKKTTKTRRFPSGRVEDLLKKSTKNPRFIFTKD